MILRIVILIILSSQACAGWTAGVWPASNTSPRKVVADGRFAKDCWQTECYSAIVERASAVGSSITPMKLYRGERINLILAKQWIKGSCHLFVDGSQSVSGSFEQYFENDPTRNRFPVLTSTGLIAMANLPDDFFDLSFYRCINSGYSKEGYGWDGVYRAITNLVFIGGVPIADSLGEPNLYHYGSFEGYPYRSNTEYGAKQGAIDNAELRFSEGCFESLPMAGSSWFHYSGPYANPYGAIFISIFSYYRLASPNSTNTSKTVDYYVKVTGPGSSKWCSKTNLYAVAESVSGIAQDTNCWSKRYGQITRMAWPSEPNTWGDDWYAFAGVLHLVKYDFEYK